MSVCIFKWRWHMHLRPEPFSIMIFPQTEWKPLRQTFGVTNLGQLNFFVGTENKMPNHIPMQIGEKIQGLEH